MKIDTTNWKEFRVGDLFDIHPTKRHKDANNKDLTNNALFCSGGANPIVVNSAYNNGVGGYTNLDTTEQGNMVTFSDTVEANTVFYQEKPFVGYPHVQGMYPIGEYADKWGKYQYLYFISVFERAASNENVDFVNKFTREIATDILVTLPIDSNNNPDWDFMEQYMKNLEITVSDSLNRLQSAKESHSDEIDTTGWKDFHLYDFPDVVSISMGNKFDKCKMTENHPTLTFVGRSGFNNGVTCMVDEVYDKDGNKVEPYKAGDITIALGGNLGASFIQDHDFYTSQNVCVLHFVQDVSIYAKRFLITAIYASCNNYEAFVEELNKHIKTDFVVWLPATSDGQPDWQYMEDYMKNIEIQIIDKLDKLSA